MKLTAKQKALMLKMGIELPKTAEQYVKESDDKARALPVETRQKFLNLINKGKTIGEAKKECGIDLDTACGIININIYQVEFLRKESV